MFKIARGFGALERGVPYVFVTAGLWADKHIDLERFIFIVEQDGMVGSELLSLKTRISSGVRTLSRDPSLDINKILEEELLLAKQHYGKWLYDRVGEKAFAQIRQIIWQENVEISNFALMYYKLNTETRDRVSREIGGSNCVDLNRFIDVVRGLRLIIN